MITLEYNPWTCARCGLTNFFFNLHCADWRCKSARTNTMNHSFLSSILDQTKCKVCKRPEKDHGKDAECEQCNNKADCTDVNGILLCPTCLEKELLANNKPPEPPKQIVYTSDNPIENLANSVKQSDAKLSGKAEFFNAETISIEEIRLRIADDTKIINKRFALAEIVHQRILAFQKAVWEADQRRFELNDRQQANQIYLNNLATQLTLEEREKVRVRDLNYPVTQPKLNQPKAPSTKAKSNKEELREAAARYKIDASAIQTVCIARNLSVLAAIELMKKTGMIKEPA